MYFPINLIATEMQQYGELFHPSPLNDGHSTNDDEEFLEKQSTFQ